MGPGGVSEFKRWGTLLCKLPLFFLEITTLSFWLPLSNFNVNVGVFFPCITSEEADLQLYFPGVLKAEGEGGNLLNVNKLLHLMRKWPRMDDTL